MTLADALETTRAPRLAGRAAVVTTRPGRAPYQTPAAMGRGGGGPVPRPGEGCLIILADDYKQSWAIMPG